MLHMSKHLNWIGSSRRELLDSLARLRHLRLGAHVELRCM